MWHAYDVTLPVLWQCFCCDDAGTVINSEGSRRRRVVVRLHAGALMNWCSSSLHTDTQPCRKCDEFIINLVTMERVQWSFDIHKYIKGKYTPSATPEIRPRFTSAIACALGGWFSGIMVIEFFMIELCLYQMSVFFVTGVPFFQNVLHWVVSLAGALKLSTLCK